MKTIDIVILDRSERSFVGYCWLIGAFLFRWRFAAVCHVKTWDEALDAIAIARETWEDCYIRVQYWGHGAPGAPLVAGKSVSPNDPRWTGCDEIWFRCCAVAYGPRGHHFMNHIAHLGVAVAAHIDIIGTWAMQSHLVGLRPGERAWWDEDIDVEESRPWRHRTVSAFKMRLPSWAFDESVKLLRRP